MTKCLLTLLCLSFTAVASAQQHSPALHFDVVNIHLSDAPIGGMPVQSLKNGDGNSHVDIHGFDDRLLLRLAFDLKPYQIEGGDNFPPMSFYDLQLKGGEEADAAFKTMSEDEARQMRMRMLQEVMAERFHLQYHWASRDMTVMKLVAGKQPKLQRSVAKPLAEGEAERKDDPSSPSYVAKWGPRGCDMAAHGWSMDRLADMLRNFLPGPVADRTGLPGLWDFSLRWAQPWMNRVAANASGTDEGPYPLIEAALAEQLDLKIERARGPVRVLVVDRIEPPTPN